MGIREYGPVWRWPNLLSLDAPVIALVWQDFLARCYRTPLALSGRLMLGLSVWAVYLLDRLLDQHILYRRNRTRVVALLGVIVCVDLTLASNWVRSSFFRGGLIVAAGVAAYLAVFSMARWGKPVWKKPFAALLFTAGTFLISWNAHAGLAVPAIAFFVLCLANLLLVGNTRYFAIGMASFSLVFIGAGNSPWFLAILISALGLGLIAYAGHRISPEVRCVLADAALLSPLLFHLRL